MTTNLVIPCFNESSRFPTTSLLEFARRTDVSLTLVDDGSTDGTRVVLREAAHQLPDRIHVVGLKSNQGKAEAVRQGMLTALGAGDIRFIGYWDADLATPLEEAYRFLDVLLGNPRLELVMGSRVQLLGRAIHRKWHRHYAGRVFATAASVSLRLPVYDTQCGAKMFRITDLTRELFSERFVSRWVFDVEILARLSAALGRRNDGRRTTDVVYEIPLDRWTDVEGSKVKPSHFVSAMVDLLRIRRWYR